MKLSKKQVDDIFEQAKHQSDYLIALYRLAVPRWDEVMNVGGFPQINKKTNAYLFDKAIAFDTKHHKNCIAGGLLLSSGFGTDDTLEDWEVSLKKCNIIYKNCAQLKIKK